MEPTPPRYSDCYDLSSVGKQFTSQVPIYVNKGPLMYIYVYVCVRERDGSDPPGILTVKSSPPWASSLRRRCLFMYSTVERGGVVG